MYAYKLCFMAIDFKQTGKYDQIKLIKTNKKFQTWNQNPYVETQTELKKNPYGPYYIVHISHVNTL